MSGRDQLEAEASDIARRTQDRFGYITKPSMELLPVGTMITLHVHLFPVGTPEGSFNAIVVGYGTHEEYIAQIEAIRGTPWPADRKCAPFYLRVRGED